VGAGSLGECSEASSPCCSRRPASVAGTAERRGATAADADSLRSSHQDAAGAAGRWGRRRRDAPTALRRRSAGAGRASSMTARSGRPCSASSSRGCARWRRRWLPPWSRPWPVRRPPDHRWRVPSSRGFLWAGGADAPGVMTRPRLWPGRSARWPAGRSRRCSSGKSRRARRPGAPGGSGAERPPVPFERGRTRRRRSSWWTTSSPPGRPRRTAPERSWVPGPARWVCSPSPGRWQAGSRVVAIIRRDSGLGLWLPGRTSSGSRCQSQAKRPT
jgi:hypothetical protein